MKWTSEKIMEEFAEHFFQAHELPKSMRWKNWRTLTVMVFDLETCDINPFDPSNRIVQFCGKVIKNCKEKGTINVYINPERSIPKEAEAVHGLTYEMLCIEKTFAEVWPKIMKFMIKHDVDILAGHNIMNFDIPMLQTQCRIHEVDIPFMPAIDSLVWFRKVKGSLSGTSNEAMGVHYRVAKTSAVKHGLAKAHDAEVDVAMTAGALYKMAEESIPYCLHDALKLQFKLYSEQTAYLMNKYKDEHHWGNWPSPFAEDFFERHLVRSLIAEGEEDE